MGDKGAEAQLKTADALEARARLAAASVGLRASKSRDRHLHSNNCGGFMLDEFGYVLWGERYDLSPQMVIEICQDLKAEASRLGIDPPDFGWQYRQLKCRDGKIRVSTKAAIEPPAAPAWVVSMAPAWCPVPRMKVTRGVLTMIAIDQAQSPPASRETLLALVNGHTHPQSRVVCGERMAAHLCARDPSGVLKLDDAASAELVDCLLDAQASLATRLEMVETALVRLAATAGTPDSGADVALSGAVSG